MKSVIRPAMTLFLLLSILLGLAYPALITGIARVAFPLQAGGSLLRDGKGRVLGSMLIGQPFSAPGYFWGRPSATAPPPYNGAASGGSNLGPSNPALREAVMERVEALHSADPGNKAPVPVDLVTASGSGLDPHISPAAAFYQIRRVATARGLPEAEIRKLVEQAIEGRFLGFLGEPRVNVLRLNTALDRLANGVKK